MVEVVKGGGGLRRAGFASTLATVKARGLQRLLEVLGLRAGADIEALNLLPVGADQTRLEALAPRRLQLGNDRPIFLGDEFFDIQFAVADEAQRHRLDAPGRTRAG